MLIILSSCQFRDENCKILPLNFQYDLSNIYFILDTPVNNVKQTGFSVLLFSFIVLNFFDYKHVVEALFLTAATLLKGERIKGCDIRRFPYQEGLKSHINTAWRDVLPDRAENLFVKYNEL